MGSYAGTDLPAWCGQVARPEVAVVTLTVAEAVYACSRPADAGSRR
jgi:hypothetical protein